MRVFSTLLFYLLILFLPTQLGYHFWPDFSFVSGFRIDYLAPTIYMTDVLIFFLFLTWMFSLGKFSIFNFQFSIKSKFKNFKIKNSFQISNFKFQIILLTTIVLIGITFSKNPFAGLYGFLKLLEFVFLGVYTAANIKRLKFGTILILFSIGIIFESFLSIAQFFNQGAIGGVFYFLGERFFNGQTPGIANASINGQLVLRPYATFPHPNVLAGYLTIALAMIISNIKYQISNIKKIVFIISLTAGTLALFLTMSRAAILIWLITLGVFLFHKFLNHKSYILILLGALLLLGLVTPLGARFTDLKLTDESIVLRQEFIQSSLLMIKENPFFGAGLNNFLVELPSYQKINNYFTELQPVHNIFLLVAAETGLIGLTFFLWFIFKTYQRIKNQESPLRRGSEGQARIKEKKIIIHDSKFMILSSVLVLGLFDHYFLTLQQGQLLFSFILGLFWSSRKK